MTDAFIPRAVISLALSNDVAIESLLSDIPLFSVGLLALGVSTFSMVMKRINLLAIYLYISALLAFGAAILDLSQILARGAANVDSGLDEGGVATGLINTREVGLALSLGFRFLYFWTFVGECPRGEQPPPLTEGSKEPRSSRGHSADWKRWGFLGFTLKWSLLALTISIPILQIIWRIAQRRFDVIYMVESTIEIVVSALFILKIILNLFLSSWRPLRFYLAPLAALGLNLGIAVGNLILFVFSETTLGRFLQAVEVYILILFLLIAAFYKMDGGPRTSRSRRSRGMSSFANFWEKPGEPSQPDRDPDEVVIGRAFSSDDEARRPTSTVSRIGSWILSRNPSQRPVNSPLGQVSDLEKDPEIQQIIVEATNSEQWDSSQLPASRSLSPSPAFVAGVAPERPTNDVSFSPYYALEPPRFSFMQLTSTSGEGSDSPVYGLDGIIGGKSRMSSEDLAVRPERSSLSSFDELLRQQTELDKSIAALKLFSPENSTPLLGIPQPASPSTSKAPPLTRTYSISTNSRLDSASARSEFSLSIFPEPPTAAENATPVPRSRSSRAAMWAPTQDLPSIPSSPSQSGISHKYDPAVTQYEITSFIGDLTVPVSTQDNIQRSSEDAISEETPSVLSPTSAASTLRPILLASSMPSVTSDPSTAPISSLNIPENSSNLNPQPTLRPFILDSVNATAVQRTPGFVPIGSRARGRSGSTSRRLNISVPRPQISDESQSPGAFERPRAPPSILPEKE